MSNTKAITKDEFETRFDDLSFNTEDIDDLYVFLTIMPEKDLKEWIEALSGGKYKQAQSHLYDGVGYCCLGVMCHLHGATNDQLINVAMPRSLTSSYFTQSNIYNKYKYNSLGLLASMNDDGKSFKEISEIINIYQNDKAQNN